MQEETLQLLVMLTDSVKEETIWGKKKKKEIVTICMRYVLYDNSDMDSDTAPYTHPSEVKAQDRRHDGLLVQPFYT